MDILEVEKPLRGKISAEVDTRLVRNKQMVRLMPRHQGGVVLIEAGEEIDIVQITLFKNVFKKAAEISDSVTWVIDSMDELRQIGYKNAYRCESFHIFKDRRITHTLFLKRLFVFVASDKISCDALKAGENPAIVRDILKSALLGDTLQLICRFLYNNAPEVLCCGSRHYQAQRVCFSGALLARDQIAVGRGKVDAVNRRVLKAEGVAG